LIDVGAKIAAAGVAAAGAIDQSASREVLPVVFAHDSHERSAVRRQVRRPHSEVRPQLIAGIHGGQTSTS